MGGENGWWWDVVGGCDWWLCVACGGDDWWWWLVVVGGGVVMVVMTGGGELLMAVVAGGGSVRWREWLRGLDWMRGCMGGCEREWAGKVLDVMSVCAWVGDCLRGSVVSGCGGWGVVAWVGVCGSWGKCVGG